MLRLFAEQCRSTFGQFAPRAELEASLARRSDVQQGTVPDIFRAEALAYHTGASGGRGDVLRIAPGWARWLYWLLALVFVVGVLVALVGTIDQYVPGRAVVRRAACVECVDTLVVALPGHTRPLLHLGMSMRLELDGYRYAYQQLTIESVEEQLSSTDDVRRILGPAAAAVLPVPSGPIALVYARLPASTFVVDNTAYRYYDGMQGGVEIRVRSERIIFTLVPGLRTLIQG